MVYSILWRYDAEGRTKVEAFAQVLNTHDGPRFALLDGPRAVEAD